MSREGLEPQHLTLGRAAAWGTFLLLVTYVLTTALGFLSLKSSLDPIGDPYFTMMELLIILVSPFMVATMVAVHLYAAPEHKAYSLSALAFMILMAGLTTCLHFSILTVGRQIDASELTWAPLFFSFKWPSVAYAVDIVAWDIFFPLSILFAVPVFGGGRLETVLRIVMVVSGVLSIVGLIGVPLADMNYRNIGILGYAVVSPVAFLILGVVFGRALQEREPRDVGSSRGRAARGSA